MRQRAKTIILKLNGARTGAVLGLTVLGACIALIALYVWFTEGEIQENRYTNYKEAQESQRRGWLPATLPRSATEIHEWHDVDPSERSLLVLGLRPGLGRPIRIDRDPSFASPLPRDPDKEWLTRAGFEFYSEQDFDLAINWKAGIAYFWNSSS
jgi:hypothetical protein